LGSGAQAAGDGGLGFRLGQANRERGVEQWGMELVGVAVTGGGELGEPEGGAVERVVAGSDRCGITRLARWRYGLGTFKADYALSGPVPWSSPDARAAGVVHRGDTLEALFRGRTPLRGLYVAGASVHPGGGVHGVSGQSAARALLSDASPVRFWR